MPFALTFSKPPHSFMFSAEILHDSALVCLSHPRLFHHPDNLEKSRKSKTSSLSSQFYIHSFISIQPQRPGWQEPEPSHVTGVALAHCILGKFLGVVDFPTFAARCLYVRNGARDPSSERWKCGQEIVR